MLNQVSTMFMMIYCMVHISMVVGRNVFDNIIFPVNPKLVIGESSDLDNFSTEIVRTTLDCSKFRRDYDVLKSLPFPVQISPQIITEKTFALMDLNNIVTELTIYKEKFVPLNIYCLKNLNTLTINNTRFHEFGLDDESIRGIPAEIGQLTLLRNLYIYDSPVQHLPKEFANLNLLIKLVIENGFLNELTTVIEKLTSLQYLKLSHNKLKTLPSTIGNLKQLNTLLLDNNELISLPSTMSSVISLLTLDLQSNQLTSIDELQGLNKLINLFAQNCKIKYLPTNMMSLTQLNMSYNNLEDLFGIGTLGFNYGNGKSFDFSYNQIDIMSPEILKIVGLLQKFSVKHNQLTHLPKEIYSLPNSPSTQLDISENWFSVDELDLIKNTMRTRLPNVKAIY